MSASVSTPRAAMPASRRSSRNSPRPQPTSSTGSRPRKSSTYGGLAFPDLVAALPHPPFEREVVEGDFRRRLRGRSCGRSLDRHGPPPLDTEQAVVELRRALRQSLVGLRDLLGEPLGRLVELGPLLLATPTLGVDAAAAQTARSSTRRRTAPLNARCSAAIGSTYQRTSLRTMNFAGAVTT